MKKTFVILGIVVLLSILFLGCTTQSTKQYTQNEPQAQVQTTPAPQVTTPATVTESPKAPVIQEIGSAMDWYDLAEAEALKWRTDVKPIEISGDNRNGNNYLAVDGKTNKWSYFFVSVPVLMKYKVVVEKGVVTSTNQYDEPLAKLMYDMSPSRDAWAIDSTAAVDIVNKKADGQAFLTTAKNIRANYLLKFAGDSATKIGWTISYFPDNYAQNFVVYVNGETGSLN